MRAAIEMRQLDFWYGQFHALRGVTADIAHGSITSLIGPSGCGKSTLLRCFNRMNERFGGTRIEGSISIQGHDIHAPEVSLIELRRSVGMVFQRPNPLPLSIYDNVLFGARTHGSVSRHAGDEMVEAALRDVDLWDSVCDRLRVKATELPLEQQQKLCIARLLPLEPSVILMDEPCSALDTDGTRAVEALMRRLAGRYTVVIVTHNMAQARRVGKDCIFMLNGELVESGPVEKIFGDPDDERTRLYVSGRYA